MESQKSKLELFINSLEELSKEELSKSEAIKPVQQKALQNKEPDVIKPAAPSAKEKNLRKILYNAHQEFDSLQSDITSRDPFA